MGFKLLTQGNQAVEGRFPVERTVTRLLVSIAMIVLWWTAGALLIFQLRFAEEEPTPNPILNWYYGRYHQNTQTETDLETSSEVVLAVIFSCVLASATGCVWVSMPSFSIN